MKRRSCLPNDPKIVVCICFGAFWICNKVLSYGRLTINFRLVVFTYTRWLFSCGITVLPDTRGDMLFYSVCKSLRSASYVPSVTSARKLFRTKMWPKNKKQLVLGRILGKNSPSIHGCIDSYTGEYKHEKWECIYWIIAIKLYLP